MKHTIPRGDVFIITAPSGTGKTTLLKKLLSNYSNFELIASHTTRKEREGSNELNYVFLSEEVFRKNIDEGKYIEYTENYGNLYGTPEIDIAEKLSASKTILFEVEWQGARAIRKRFPEAVHIFLLPINPEILRSRIVSRGTSTSEEIDRRMKQSFEEMSHFAEADFLIFNDDFETAYQELVTIIAAEKLRVPYVSSHSASKLEKLFNQNGPKI